MVPAAALAMGLGLGAVAVSLKWARGDRSVGVIADLLTIAPPGDEEAIRHAAELEAALPSPSWWSTTADQMGVRLAAATGGANEPGGPERVAMLVDAGRSATPAEPGPRLARGWRESRSGEPSAPGARLGLSRDAVASTWSARGLMQAGELEASSHLYRLALERAGRMPLDATDQPASPKESETRRFALPYEERLGLIVRDLVASSGRPMADWEAALPDSSLVVLAVARRLGDRGSPDAVLALKRAVELSDQTAPEGFDRSVHRAAGAEALALLGRLDEAARRYREAIEWLPKSATGPRGFVERSWAYNLADVYARLNDSEGMRMARAEALDTAPDDEITTLVVRSQLRDGLKREPTEGGGASSGRLR